MTNGDSGVPRIPGFFVAGGIGLSNTAILIGGAALAAWLWLSMNKKPTMRMDDESIAQDIEADVMSYAANSTSFHLNRDRIRAAINAIRDTFRAAREAYTKKLRDLVKAKQAGTITQEQFRQQHRAALAEFKAAIRARHKEIMEQLGIPHTQATSNIAEMVPTVG